MSPLFGRPSLYGRDAVLRGLLLLLAVILASAPLSILLAGSTWFLLAATAAVLVIVPGMLLRSLLRNPLLIPVLQVVILVIALLALQAGQGLIPLTEGPSALVQAQEDVIVTGMDGLASGWAPLTLGPTESVLVVMLLALGVLGLDLMFLDLGWHTPTALALMGFQLVPALQQPTGGAWWTVAGPVLGGLLVLSARTLHADPSYVEGDQRPQAGPLAHPDRTAGAIALSTLLVVALTVPLAQRLPQTAAPTIPLSMDTLNTWQQGTAPNLGPVMIDDDVSVRRDLLRGEPRTVLEYTTTDTTPSYLRLRTLNRYVGDTFRQEEGPFDPERPRAFSDLTVDGMPLRPEQGPLLEQDIQVLDLGGDRLPLPDNVRGLQAADGTLDGEIREDVGEFALDGASDLSGSRYRVQSEERASTAEELRAVDPGLLTAPFESGYIDPGAVPEQLRRTATTVAENARAENAYDTALAYQDYFRTGFAYSLTVRTPPAADPLESFLEDRIGYCEQFAASFALMMTSRGYPSRVVIGFTAGQRSGDGWTVTSDNAHAWPEVWFGPEHGWVPFEPTPSAAANGVRPPVIPDDQAASTAEPEAPPEQEEPTAPEAETPTTEAEQTTTPTDAGTAGDGSAEAAGLRGGQLALLLGVLAAAALAAATVLRGRRQAAQREERWARAERDGGREVALTAWAELESVLQRRDRHLSRLGWTGRDGRPPLPLALDRALPPRAAIEELLTSAREGGLAVGEEHEQAGRRLAHAVHQARYAPAGAGGGATSTEGAAQAPGADTLREDVVTLAALLQSRPRRS